MKAIKTKYKGPSNTRGSHIIASDEDGNRVTLSYPYELSGEDVHRKAAEALCDKMKWEGKSTLIGGGLKNGYVFVFGPPMPKLINALEIAEITIARLDRNGSGKGTLDVISKVLNLVR